MSCLIEREGLGERESPALLECTSDHCAAGGRRRTCQTERVLELETTHLDRHVDVVDRRMEQRQTRHVAYCSTEQRLQPQNFITLF